MANLRRFGVTPDHPQYREILAEHARGKRAQT